LRQDFFQLKLHAKAKLPSLRWRGRGGGGGLIFIGLSKLKRVAIYEKCFISYYLLLFLRIKENHELFKISPCDL